MPDKKSTPAPPHGIQETKLTSFKIKNFKAVGEWQKVPLKPVTLIFGKNSAGKSTILQSLAYVHDLLFRGDVNQILPSKGKGFINLGGFRQFIHFNEKGEAQNELGFAFSFEINFSKIASKIEDFYTNIEKLFKNANSSKNGGPKESLTNMLNAAAIGIKETKKRTYQVFKRKEGDSVLNVDIEILIENTTSGSTGPNFNQFEKTPVVSVYFDKEKIVTFDTNIKWQDADTGAAKNAKADDERLKAMKAFVQRMSTRSRCTFLSEEFANNVASKLVYPIFYSSFGEKTLQTIDWKNFKTVTEEMGNLILLSSLQIVPNKIQIFPFQVNPIVAEAFYIDELKDNIKKNNPEGSFLSISKVLTAELICHICDSCRDILGDFLMALRYLEGIRYTPDRFINEYNILKEKNMEGKSSLLSYNDLFKDKKIVSQTNTALEELGADFKIEIEKGGNPDVGDSLFVVKNSRKMSFKDIGFGWSQVVPVLVEAFDEKNSVLCCEQPELHLHPSAQSELLSVLACRSTKSKKPLLLFEAHSEQMVLRLLRLIREGSLSKHDASVIYVQREQEKGINFGAAVFTEIIPDEHGRVGSQWPEDFFASGMRDLI